MGVLGELCPPALVYVAFSLTHSVVDLFKGLYNTALVKLTVMVLFTAVLEILCRMKLQAVAWLVVFIPFVALTVVAALLLYFLELSPRAGRVSRSRDGALVEGHAPGIQPLQTY